VGGREKFQKQKKKKKNSVGGKEKIKFQVAQVLPRTLSTDSCFQNLVFLEFI
jgi:hypothetical protein